MGFWIVDAENIKGNGTNKHIFKGTENTMEQFSFCGEEIQTRQGRYYHNLSDLKEAIRNSGRELCAKCSGSAVHTDL